MNWTLFWSGLTAFLITAMGSLVIAVNAAAGRPLSATTWLMIVGLGLGSMAKDIRSLLKLPPISNGGGDEPPPRTDGPGAAGKTILPLLFLFSVFSLLLIAVGCSTTNRTAYQGEATARVGAGLAVNEWNLYVAQKHPPRAQQIAVRNAFEKWKAGMLVLCDAGATFSAAVGTNAPADMLGQLTAALEQAIADSAQDQSDLVNLITTFGVKISPPTGPPEAEFTPLPVPAK